MKTKTFIISAVLLVRLLPHSAFAQIPVTDVANLTNNTIAHAENIAKWVESINSLRTQIDQLNRQINIHDDIRRRSGNPVEAGGKLVTRARTHFTEADTIMAEARRKTVRAPRVMSEVYRMMLERMAARGFAAPRKRVRIGRLRLLPILLRHTIF